MLSERAAHSLYDLLFKCTNDIGCHYDPDAASYADTLKPKPPDSTQKYGLPQPVRRNSPPDRLSQGASSGPPWRS